MDASPIVNTYFIDGNYRAVPSAPEKWLYGHCRRPLGLYFINNKKRFITEQYSNPLGNTIEKGWYPLRSHILGISDYRSDLAHNNNSFNFDSGEEGFYANAGMLDAGDLDNVGKSNMAGEYNDDLDKPYQFRVGVAHQGNAGADGDWQFQSGGKHNTIGIGVS